MSSTTTHAPNTNKGCVHIWSRSLIPTAKEAPTDAEAISHQLMARAGYIRRVAAGIYDLLPMGHRVVRNISQIVREEMDAAGGAELFLPHLTPVELFQTTGRAEAYGDLLFNFEDRHGRCTALGPTHEEVITELLMSAVDSYKQLPLTVYQIQTKFRDEFRPRAGLLRGREFLMKDAYSFHINLEGPGGLNETYDRLYVAYENIFRRCGLDYSVVEAESGPIGGSASHEFMVNTPSGEDTILKCPVSGYAANVEKCETGERTWSFAGEPTGELEEVHTPGCPGIKDVSKLLKIKPANMLKSVVFKVESTPADLEKYGEEWVIAVVRGDHEVNESKVRDAAECSVVLADPDEARAMGFEIGFVSPRAAIRSDPAEQRRVLMLIDPDVAQGMDTAKGKPMFWVTGGDKKDYHVKHFDWERDLGAPLPNPEAPKNDHNIVVADIRNALAGDPSPKAEGARLEESRGIEVGHIFKLGTKYSDAMGFAILDEQQERRSVIMGCYGIGVSRVAAACVEMSHDEHGIIWPVSIAPYHCIITIIKPDDALMSQAQQLAEALAEQGLHVLIDDRDESACPSG